MEILLWLLPAALLTLASMAWVGWWGREGRGEVDRETAARRLGEALGREQRTRPGYAAQRRPADRITGVALRATTSRPVVLPGSRIDQPAPEIDTGDAAGDSAGDRRAS